MFTSLRPADCSVVEAVMSDMKVTISATELWMPSSALPACPTSSTPRFTWLAESEIRPAISRAASEERCASARTSEATTAKPRPASPARAASTPAFSARRLVWNEISSITEVMREILFELSEISPIACTASRTT